MIRVIGFFTIYLLANNLCDVTAWMFSASPNRVIEYDNDIPAFKSDGSDFFKLLSMDDRSLLVGAKNNVYNLSLTELNENRARRIEWKSSEAHKEMCLLKGKNNSDCQNYIRVSANIAENQVMLCGTNSWRPLCRYYKLSPDKDNHQIMQEFEFEGEAIAPYSPTQNNTYYFQRSTGEFYSATSVGFAGQQTLILKQKLSYPPPSYSGMSSQTLRTDFRNDILNQDASFVSSFEYKSWIFFFFREQGVENKEMKSIYSRVSRICIGDKGGSHPFHEKFSSFLKTRLNCSVPGDFPFYFDVLQATSEVVNVNNDSLIYTVFNTPDNSIDGSAICVFSMRSILEAFEGKFKNQRDIHSVWRALDESEVPSPRPGQCVEDSRTLPNSNINFILRNPILNEAVSPISDSPLVVHTAPNYKFTTIAVDPQVQTLKGSLDVIYIGTNNGQVLKLYNAASESATKPIIVSEQQVLPPGTLIKELKVTRSNSLIVISDNFIRTIALHNCSSLLCSDCLSDPYCAWDNHKHQCSHFNQTTKTEGMVGLFEGEKKSICGTTTVIKVNSHPTDTRGTVSSLGKNPLPDENEASVDFEESMKNHKYYNIGPGVIHAPSQSTHFEPQIQSSSSVVALLVIVTLIVGIIGGFTIAKCIVTRNNSRNSFPFGATVDSSNHRNQLGWQANTNKHLLTLPTMNNREIKDINLLNANNINKKDNLELEFSLGNKDRTHECKNSNESLDKEMCKSVISPVSGGTLKVKKTYI